MRKLAIIVSGIVLSACVVNVERQPRQAHNAPPPQNGQPAHTDPVTTAPPANTAPPPTAPPPASTTTAPPANTGPGPTGAMMPFEELPEPPPTEPPIDVKLVDADGRPTALVAGAPLGVWIWIDRDQTWHVRTTTHSQMHRFQGVVMTVRDNTLSDVKPVRLEMNDRLRTHNGRVAAWDFSTNGHEDGFDFKTAGSQCIRFFVKVDGKADPAAINVGKNAAHPSRWHFRLCP